MNEDRRNAAMDAALRYLSYKSRTCKQIREYLIRKGFDENLVELILEALKEYDYINDQRYVNSSVESSVIQKKESLTRAKQRLIVAGADKETIESALDEIDPETELENAKALVEKLSRSASNDKKSAREKIYRRLLSRGFSYDVAKQAISSICDQCEEYFDDYE